MIDPTFARREGLHNLEIFYALLPEPLAIKYTGGLSEVWVRKECLHGLSVAGVLLPVNTKDRPSRAGPHVKTENYFSASASSTRVS